MESISVDQFLEHPDKLLIVAQSGEISMVTRDEEPIFMSIPMGEQLDRKEVRLEVAISLFEREQISIGVASRIAGMPIGQLIEELGRRRIPVIRYSVEDLEKELKYFKGPAESGPL